MFGAGLAPAQVANQRPNVVFMLADNLAYGELGVYGGGVLRGAPTPHIDKLASEGMRLPPVRDTRRGDSRLRWSRAYAPLRPQGYWTPVQ